MSDPDRITRAWAQGRARWTFAVPVAAFADAVQASQSGDGDAEELYLAAGCQLGLADALQAFEREYLARIPTTLARQGFARDKIDEAMQRVREDLLVAGHGEPMIRLCRYAGSGRLASLVRVSATRYARRAGGPVHELLGEFWTADDPASDLLTDELGRRFKEAFATAIAGCSAQEKVLLRMVFVENLSYREVAELFAVSKSTICRQLAELERRLVKQLTALWRERAGAPLGEDLGEIIAAQLDLSFSRLLRGG